MSWVSDRRGTSAGVRSRIEEGPFRFVRHNPTDPLRAMHHPSPRQPELALTEGANADAQDASDTSDVDEPRSAPASPGPAYEPDTPAAPPSPPKANAPPAPPMPSVAERAAANFRAMREGRPKPFEDPTAAERAAANEEAARAGTTKGERDPSTLDPLHEFYIQDPSTRKSLLAAYMLAGIAHRLLLLTAIIATFADSSLLDACFVAVCAFTPSLASRHVWRSLMRQREPHRALRVMSWWGLVGTTIAMAPYVATRAFGSVIVSLFTADGILTAAFVSDSSGRTSLAAAPRFRTLFAFTRSVGLVPKAITVVACVVAVLHPPSAIVFAMMAWCCDLLLHAGAIWMERKFVRNRRAVVRGDRLRRRQAAAGDEEDDNDVSSAMDSVYSIDGNDGDLSDQSDSSGDEDEGAGVYGNARRMRRMGRAEPDSEDLVSDAPAPALTPTPSAGFSFVQAEQQARAHGLGGLRVPRAPPRKPGSAGGALVSTTDTEHISDLSIHTRYRDMVTFVASMFGTPTSDAQERRTVYRALAVISFANGFTSGAIEVSRAALALVLTRTDAYTIMLGATIAYLSAIIGAWLVVNHVAPRQAGRALSFFVLFIYIASVVDVMTGGRDPSLLTLTHIVVTMTSECFSAYSDWEAVRWCGLPENRLQYVADLFTYMASAQWIGTLAGVLIGLVFAKQGDYNVFTPIALVGIAATFAHRHVERSFGKLAGESERDLDIAMVVARRVSLVHSETRTAGGPGGRTSVDTRFVLGHATRR